MSGSSVAPFRPLNTPECDESSTLDDSAIEAPEASDWRDDPAERAAFEQTITERGGQQ